MLKEETKVIHKKILNYYLSVNSIAAQSFDKAILSLSTASIGFTILLINSMRQAEIVINYPILLWFTWLCFIVSIIATLITFIFLQKHSAHRMKFFSSEIMEESQVNQLEHWTDKKLCMLQYICASSFVTGLIIFAIFFGCQY